MSNSKYKDSAPGTYYHLYNRGNQKNRIFLDDNDFSFYRRKLGIVCKKYDFSLVAYCLMPNHIHLIVKQNSEFSTASFMSSLHTSYSMIFNKKYKTVGHLFQDRFKQKIICGDDYMKKLVAYVHLNPVKDGLCAFPKEYKWSSYLEYARKESFNDSERICDCGLIEDYGFKGQSFEEFINLAGQIIENDAFDD